MPDLLDRVGRVRLLLETLDDPYPTPKGALRSDSGPAASRYVPCETCRRTGRVRTRSALVLCLVCDGAGWKRREPGDALWDAYVGLPVEEAADLPSMPLAPRRDADVEETSYAWERARASYDRHGSYKEVRLRLEQLGYVAPYRARLIRHTLVEKVPRLMGAVDDAEMMLGVTWITLRMRSIRVPPWIMERSAAAEKRETIAALVADGYPAGEIARRTGMTKEAVRRKIRRLRAVHSAAAGVPIRAT